ncbi:gas vesicle protein GvpG [Streptomyces sp. ME01-24h]|nr:gas vesicle protein GvpG [Streptomyces sp. ME19-03-3]MDX3354032.1 gas vesicle protein GvpG [Streptomyces sp. ME01-24h]
MGLLTGLLTLPVAPLRGVTWVLDQVVAEARRQQRDPSAVERELAELERQLLAGRLSEEEFDRREDELLDRLEALRDATEPPGFGQGRHPNG